MGLLSFQEEKVKYYVMDETDPAWQGYERDSLEEATDLLGELQKDYPSKWVIVSKSLQTPVFGPDEYRMA